MIINTKIFTATVETAQAKSANNPAMLRSILRAVNEINRSKYWAYDSQTNVLKLMSTTSKKLYVIDDNHTCEAQSKTCKHLVARRLMRRYTEALGTASVEVETKTAQAWNVETGTTTATHTRAIVTDSTGKESVHGVFAVAPAHAPTPSNSIAAVEKAASIFPVKMLDFGKDVFAGRPRGIARRQRWDWHREF